VEVFYYEDFFKIVLRAYDVKKVFQNLKNGKIFKISNTSCRHRHVSEPEFIDVPRR
jgi:hypothetical protein